MPETITIKKGLNLPLDGSATGKVTELTDATRFAIVPDDFPGYIWKAAVKAGDRVKIGSPLLQAKDFQEVCLVSPIAGTVVEVHRGERRKIEFVEVKKDGQQESVDVNITPGCTIKDEIMPVLCRSGLFAFMRQRPYDIVPQLPLEPRDIFVTAFDTAPLAPEFPNQELASYLENGLKVLSALTHGKVYLSVKAGSGMSSDVAEVYEFNGPHPAGNVGVQIAQIAPVNKGEIIWTLDAETAARIGKLFAGKGLDFSADVAITGPEANDPHTVKTSIGVALESLLKGNLKNDGKGIRVISGNVLTGKQVDPANGFLRFPYRQITAIEEGDHADEFMGWASMNPKKYSVKHTFPAFLRGAGAKFNFDARLKGGHRAMIMSGEYDKVFPFDIYPEFLIKAILAKNIDRMEQLGIYEVAPEDFALPEFVDTSKLPLQKIVRDGLDYLRKETE